jgi:DtxR family Mn-dependent transcriptional regulator
MQDYLEVILDLSEAAAEEGIRVTDIAARLNITKASVTQAIQALKESGLVTHERYGTVRLTRAGRQRALEVRHRHRTLRRFLVEVLGVDARTAEKDACLMEHAVSRQTMEKLVEFLERVGRDGASGVREGAAEDRSGASPPAEDGREKRIMRSVNIKALSELRPGERGRVVRVGAGAQVRRRILDMGVTLGTEIEVKGVAPFGDPIKLLVKGYDLSLRKQEAATVFVEVL